MNKGELYKKAKRWKTEAVKVSHRMIWLIPGKYEVVFIVLQSNYIFFPKRE